MTDTMTVEEYQEYQRTNKLPERFEKQTRSSLLTTIAGKAPDVLDEAVNADKKHKYGAQATVIGGIRFDSRAEARRYAELKQLEQSGLIVNLELQPRFDFVVNGQKLPRTFYKADFRYVDVATDEVVVEDVKGMITPIYQLKKKLMKACHGIEIVEVQA